MPNPGEQECIDGNMMTWKSPNQLADSGDGDVTNVDLTNTNSILSAILTTLQSIEHHADNTEKYLYDTSFDSPIDGSYPFGVYTFTVAPNTVQQEQSLLPPARSMILISDQALLLNMYTRSSPPWTVQNQSGTTDYLLKQVSLWSLPRSWAIPKLYISNSSTSATANVQIITWG
jgi:hypothetical protein